MGRVWLKGDGGMSWMSVGRVAEECWKECGCRMMEECQGGVWGRSVGRVVEECGKGGGGRSVVEG